MKTNKIITALVMSMTFSACALVDAKSSDEFSNKIYVYEDCELIQEITMTDEQQAAYQALKKQEVSLHQVERPVHKFEQEIAEYEKELNDLEGELVTENNDKLVINKQLVRQHKALAKKMEKLAQLHEQDFRNIEQEARKVEVAARKFERLIRQVLPERNGRNQHVQIGNSTNNWKCNA